MGLVAVCVLWQLLATAVSTADQRYEESLLLKQLPDGKTLAHFEHKISWHHISPIELAEDDSNSQTTVNHYGMFPRSVAEIVGHYRVQELHLSLTRGKWKSFLWGYPPLDTPPGAEFWAWFLPDTPKVDYQWKGLLHALSGLICASLNAVDPSSTYQPLLSFKPEGALIGNISLSQLRYTALPREPVCTENMTPWSKLLPCGQKAGLGSLYIALKLYESVYHSLSLKVLPVCQDSDCLSVSTDLIQSLTVVFDTNSHELSLETLFTKNITSYCPISSQSLVYIDITSHLPVQLTPDPVRTISLSAHGQDNLLAVYDLHKTNNSLGISLVHYRTQQQVLPSPPLLNIQRYVTGSGHERGGLYTIITNSYTNESVLAALLDMVPWYFRLLYHTLQLECHQEINGSVRNCMDKLIVYQHYTPARDRSRPYTLEHLFSLPPQSSIKISIQFLRAFLKWNEHPPDASHGFFINSAVLTSSVQYCPNCTVHPNHSYSKFYRIRIHSETVLVSLPIPDFSMPYNVICFVSTIVAIGFGSLFNLTTKSLSPETDEDRKGLISRLLTRVKHVFLSQNNS